MFRVVRAVGATPRMVDDENISGRMYRLHGSDIVSDREPLKMTTALLIVLTVH
jgi:hypothetical protein